MLALEAVASPQTFSRHSEQLRWHTRRKLRARMRLELLLGGKKQQVEVVADHASIGGTEQDTVRVPGAPAKLVELRREGASWLLRTRVQGRINGVPFAALVPRVWVPGETLSMGPGLSILHVSETAAAVPGTAAVAKEMLGTFEAPAMSPLPVLICLTGTESGRRFQLTAANAVVGRAEDAPIRLRDASVSRRHAKLEQVQDRLWIEDLDSPNGVFVNGRRITRRALLPDGAVIEIGQTLLRLQLPEVAPPPAEKILSAEPMPIPMAAEPEAKLQLVRPAPECEEAPVAHEPKSPSRNQVLRLSVIAARLRLPQVPTLSTMEWAIVAGGAAMMVLGALVSWTFLS
ncbi:MAG: FHA domain-containing protein [Myxococcaceae bacterium]